MLAYVNNVKTGDTTAPHCMRGALHLQHFCFDINQPNQPSPFFPSVHHSHPQNPALFLFFSRKFLISPPLRCAAHSPEFGRTDFSSFPLCVMAALHINQELIHLVSSYLLRQGDVRGFLAWSNVKKEHRSFVLGQTQGTLNGFRSQKWLTYLFDHAQWVPRCSLDILVHDLTTGTSDESCEEAQNRVRLLVYLATTYFPRFYPDYRPFSR